MPLADNRVGPIWLSEICMLCLERRQAGCLKDAKGGHSRRSRKLNYPISVCLDVDASFLHTVDIGSRRERGVVRESLGDVVVCPTDVLIFLSAVSATGDDCQVQGIDGSLRL